MLLPLLSLLAVVMLLCGGYLYLHAEQIIQSQVFNLLQRIIQRGRLQVNLVNKEERVFGNSKAPEVRLDIFNTNFFKRILFSSDIGLAESYIAGEWKASDLTAFIELLILNKDNIDQAPWWVSMIGSKVNTFLHWLQRNTVRQSRKNIQNHYDLSNEMFTTFLDKSMMYSCAVYKTPQDSLYTAQQHKIDLLLHKLHLKPTDHVLEIGCGWGEVAIQGVRRYGCRWTGISLSDEQTSLAKKRVSEAGLSDKIDFQIIDYRLIKGKFDKIVSCEMLEAVGHEFYGAYFESLDRLLKPDGVAVIQVITIPDQRYENYRSSADFIQKHIFPGGLCPSLTALCNAMTESSSFTIHHLENIGFHYAQTLREWREAFMENKEKIREMVNNRNGSSFGDEFINKWDYYFCYCEAGFKTRTLNDLQLVLTRPGNSSLPIYEPY